MDRMVKRGLIKDKKLADSIEKDGFGVVSFLDRSAIVELQTLFLEYYRSENQPTIFNSLEKTTPEKRRAIHERIVSVCRLPVEHYIENFKVVIAMFFVKKPGKDGLVGIHNDPSMTTENYTHLGIWIPLTDTNGQNGTMNFVRGSHKFSPPYHGKTIPSPYSNVGKVLDANLDTVNVKAGDAVIFDNNVLHCTRSNNTTQVRTAVVIKLIDIDAPVVSFFRDEKSRTEIEIIKHSDNYYISPQLLDTGVRPQAGERIALLDYEERMITEEELLQLLWARDAGTGSTPKKSKLFQRFISRFH